MEIFRAQEFFDRQPECSVYRPVRCQTLPVNVRQLVINKQNRRIFATRDQLIDRMEDALVRWRPPLSCHAGSTAALRGKHPYQLKAEPSDPGFAFYPSMSVIKHRLDTLGDTVMQMRPTLDTVSSSNSGMAGEIRESVENTGAGGCTPWAIPVYDQDEHAPLQISAQASTYNFPVPPYYLQEMPRTSRMTSVAVQGPVPGNNDYHTQSSLWEKWVRLCRETWGDVVAVCGCNTGVEPSV